MALPHMQSRLLCQTVTCCNIVSSSYVGMDFPQVTACLPRNWAYTAVTSVICPSVGEVSVGWLRVMSMVVAVQGFMHCFCTVSFC